MLIRFKPLIAAVLAASLAFSSPSFAHRTNHAASEASALSMLPIAVSVAVPAVLLVGGAALTVAAVSTVAEGTVWVLERASDGTQASLRFSGELAVGASVAVGTVVVVTAISTGWVLSAAGKAIAFIPNEVGKALLHNERVSR